MPMRYSFLALPLLLGLALPVNAQRIVRVGTTQTNTTIQAALDDALDQDTILVDALDTHEQLTFPHVAREVTLTALGTVLIDGLDTHNAPSLTVQGAWTIRRPTVQSSTLPVIRIRSDDVRIVGMWCDGVDAPCIGATRPQHRIVIDSIAINDVPVGIIAKGSDWLVINASIGPLTPGPILERIGIRLQGSRMVARGNQVIGGNDTPIGICLVVSSTDDRRIVLDNNLCVQTQGLRIEHAGQLIVQQNQFGVGGAVAVESFADAGEVLFRENFVTSSDGCGLALRTAGSSFHVRGNVFLQLGRAYCAQTLAIGIMEGNLLQAVTAPTAAPNDVVETAPSIGIASEGLLLRALTLRSRLR